MKIKDFKKNINDSIEDIDVLDKVKSNSPQINYQVEQPKKRFNLRAVLVFGVSFAVMVIAFILVFPMFSGFGALKKDANFDSENSSSEPAQYDSELIDPHQSGNANEPGYKPSEGIDSVVEKIKDMYHAEAKEDSTLVGTLTDNQIESIVKYYDENSTDTNSSSNENFFETEAGMNYIANACNQLNIDDNLEDDARWVFQKNSSFNSEKEGNE